MKANEFILNKISTVFSESIESFKEFNVPINQEREKLEIYDNQKNNTDDQISHFFSDNSFGNINLLK